MSVTVDNMRLLSAEMAERSLLCHGADRAWFARWAVFLNHTASRLRPQRKDDMGMVAEKINALETALSTERATSAGLRTQLTAAQADQLDAADKAALDGVDAAVAAT